MQQPAVSFERSKRLFTSLPAVSFGVGSIFASTCVSVVMLAALATASASARAWLKGVGMVRGMGLRGSGKGWRRRWGLVVRYVMVWKVHEGNEGKR